MTPRNKKEDPEIHCQHCGVLLRRTRSATGVLEQHSTFVLRKFCSRKCAAIKHSEPGVRPRTSDDPIAWRKWSRELKARTACSRCGAGGRLHVHHKDGNFRNLELENLEVVCPMCHKQIHHPTLSCALCSRRAYAKHLCSAHYQEQRRRARGVPARTRKVGG